MELDKVISREEKKRGIVKVKLNYRAAVSKTPPVEVVPVDGAKISVLDSSIREKCRQNHLRDNQIENDGFYYADSGIKKLVKKRSSKNKM